jgi:hypothetical protein
MRDGEFAEKGLGASLISISSWSCCCATLCSTSDGFPFKRLARSFVFVRVRQHGYKLVIPDAGAYRGSPHGLHN